MRRRPARRRSCAPFAPSSNVTAVLLPAAILTLALPTTVALVLVPAGAWVVAISLVVQAPAAGGQLPTIPGLTRIPEPCACVEAGPEILKLGAAGGRGATV